MLRIVFTWVCGMVNNTAEPSYVDALSIPFMQQCGQVTIDLNASMM
jgi:hypothetical protein